MSLGDLPGSYSCIKLLFYVSSEKETHYMAQVLVKTNDVPAWEPWIPPLWGNEAKDMRYWDGIHCRFVKRWIVEYTDLEIEFKMIFEPKFLTDGGSIPSAARGLILPYGIGILAWFVHDCVYGCHYLPKEVADTIMLRLLEYVELPRWKRYGAYSAVSLFGGPSYSDCEAKFSEDGSPIVEMKVGRTTIVVPDYRRLFSSFEVYRLSGKLAELADIIPVVTKSTPLVTIPA
jgi:hypothetical protein